ncbi:MAG: acyl-CoA dehydrogenase [Chitinivibrionales bacterium]|nr:acyl-CoA dehydrogenase [Chitinivibrionales bacterium]
MNWFLTEEQQMIIETARELAEKKIVPVREEYDREGVFPWDVVKAMAEADLCGLYIPEEYGGMGGGVFELCLAVEELSKACGGISLAMAATALGTFPILLFGSDEQKKKYLPSIATGEKLAAFGLTEANAGSDAIGMMKTTAKLEGDHYVLNGTKQWITNGENAEIYTVLARTNPARGARGISAFIVEKGTEGFSFGKHEDKMGIRASSTTELVFQNCKIPKENLLGKEGLGAIITINTLNYSRPGVGSQALGIAAGALKDAIQYSRERVQFGGPVSAQQAVQHILADMATDIEAARALLYATAKTIDAGEKRFSKESAMSKLFCSDVAMRVTVDALQVMGGYGYMREYPMEKRMRDAKITQIYEGTNQIQRNEIALQLIKGA